MSDDFLPNKNRTNNKRGFFALLLQQLFHNLPKNSNELLTLISNLKQKKVITETISEMIENVINLSNQRVKDIMIPRSQIITLRKNQSITEYIDIIIHTNYSRFPVINENKDYVEGILVVKDILPFILQHNKLFNIETILSPAIIVPENKRIDRMLQEFNSQRYNMAIIINEFGGISGLITINNILEVILGKIKDKCLYNNNMNIKRLNHHTFVICALTSIVNFNTAFNTDFNDKEIDTIGGLVMQSFGHLPTCGEDIDLAGYNFKVIIVDNQRIIQLQVTIPENSVQENHK